MVVGTTSTTLPFPRRGKTSASWRRLPPISRIPKIVRNIQLGMLLAIAIQSWELISLVPWDPNIVLRSTVFETSEKSPFASPVRGHGVIDNAFHDGFISVPSNNLNWVI